MSEFSVTLSNAGKGANGCDGIGCRKPAAYVATLAYCYCDDQPAEHGHPGHPDADRHDVGLCTEHAALVRSSWECLERITDYRPEVSA
jgi:hypothetical protein